MADYVVRLNGLDNLTSTIDKAKKELNDFGKVGQTASEKIDAKFNKIINSSAPLKRQLRDLQALMAKMNFDGLSNTEQFTLIALAAGRVKDAISDAATATLKYANDTQALLAGIQAFQGLAAAGTIAAGAMSLFGSENEDAAKAILKVQGVLAILNGVQTVANTLNKDSALMLKLKQIRMVATTAATTGNTVATTANTTATVANNVAMKAWNVTKAIGKALLGDFTGLLIVGAGALAAYAIATADSSDEQSKLNDNIDKGTSFMEKQTAASKEVAKSIDAEKYQISQLISVIQNENVAYEDKVNALNQLKGIIPSVNGYISSEGTYHGNAVLAIRNHIKALDDLSKALAAFKLGQKIQEDVTTAEWDKFQANQKVLRKQNNIRADEREMQRHQNDGGYTWNGGRSQQYLDAQNRKKINETNLKAAEVEKENADNRLKVAQRQQQEFSQFQKQNGGSVKAQTAVALANGDVNKAIDLFIDRDKITSPKTGGGGRSTGGGRSDTNATNTDKKEIIKGSLSDLENQLNTLQTKLKDGLIPTDKVEETKIIIEKLKDDILKKKIELGLEIDPELKESEEAKKKVQDEVKKYFENKQDIQLTPQLSTFDKAVGNNPFDTSTLNGIENLISFNEALIESLKESKEELEKFQQELIKTGQEGSEEFSKVTDKLNTVNDALLTVTDSNVVLSDEASKLNKKQTDWENKQKEIDSYSEAISQLGSTFSSLGGAMDESTGQWLNFTAQALEGTAKIIPVIQKLILAKQAEAIASGTAEGAKMHFPANIAAILSIVATVASVFASLPKFASGGIVSGGSTHGDNVLARLNGNEMVLNPRQQSNLFKAINSGSFEFGKTDNANPTINFKIKGSDLYGTLKNYSKTAAKSGRITGIQ